MFLTTYPYDCCEQLSSKILTLAGLRDTVEAFESNKLPRKGELKGMIETGLKTLKKRQQGNGGFGMWAYDEVNPFVTCHVGHALGVCKQKGYSLPWFIEKRVTSYLKEEIFIKGKNDHHGRSEQNLITIYSLYARYRMNPSEEVKKEVEEYYNSISLDNVPMEGLGLMMSVLGDEIGRAHV